MRKKDFNILHGRYGAGKRKRPSRITREEVRDWDDQTKKDNYWAGRKQRKDLKGLTRAGRLAYFKRLREDWDEDKLKAWKESWRIKKWRIKKDTWNKKRQPRRKKEPIEEPLIEEASIEKTPQKKRARKSEAERLCTQKS